MFLDLKLTSRDLLTYSKVDAYYKALQNFDELFLEVMKVDETFFTKGGRKNQRTVNLRQLYCSLRTRFGLGTQSSIGSRFSFLRSKRNRHCFTIHSTEVIDNFLSVGYVSYDHGLELVQLNKLFIERFTKLIEEKDLAFKNK